MIDLPVFLLFSVAGLILIGGSRKRTTEVLHLRQLRPAGIMITGGLACLTAALAEQVVIWGWEVGVIRAIMMMAIVGVVLITGVGLASASRPRQQTKNHGNSMEYESST